MAAFFSGLPGDLAPSAATFFASSAAEAFFSMASMASPPAS